MWIEKVKDGFKFREAYKDTFTGKYMKVSVTLPSKSRAAQKQAREMLDDMIKAKSGRCKSLRLYDLIQSYIESRHGFVKDSTINCYIYTAKKIFTYWPKDTLVSALTSGRIQDLIDKLTIECSADYAKKTRSLIKSAFSMAYLEGTFNDMTIIDRTTVHRPVKSVAEVKKEREKFLSREELTEVLSMIRQKSERLAEIFEFQALTGLRFGELAALRFEDYKNGEISVNATLVWAKTKGAKPHRGSPKNVYSVRKVKLDRRATYIIEHAILRDKQQRRWFPTKSMTDDKFIFVNRDGGPLDLSYVNRVLRGLKYKKRISTHIFRHTHISLLAEQGVPLKAIMQRVGHHDPRTTMEIYTHVSQSMEDSAVKALNAL